MQDLNTAGNDIAADSQSVDTGLEQGTEQRVNPGMIRKSQTQGILNALSNASGQQFESVEAAVAWAARIGAQQNFGGNEQPMEQPKQQRSRQTNNDLAEQFSKLQQDLQVKEQRLRERDLDADIQRVMGERFDSDLLDYALNKVKSNIQWNHEDGTYSIVNSKGQERYGSDGTPLSLQGLVSEVAKGNPKLLKQSQQNSGSGLRPGQGSFAGEVGEAVPDYTRDPAAFNAWAARNGLGKNVGLKGMGVSASVSSGSRKLF